MKTNMIMNGDALTHLKELESESINCVMTSPPYWALRDYGIEGQLGLESTFDEYISKLCDIFDEVNRVLRKDGTCWVNLGDTYGWSGMGTWRTESSPSGKQVYSMPYGKNMSARMRGKTLDKSLVMIPFRFAIEMVNRGWILRNTIIWHKPNCMPSSIKDRFTVDFEYLFFFTKSKKYWFETQYEPHQSDGKYKPFNKRVRDTMMGRVASYQYKVSEKEKAMWKENSMRKHHSGNTNPDAYNPLGRNKRSVWIIPTSPFPEAHFATYPETLCETPIKAGCPQGGIVLDPFFGAGTTGLVALKQKKQFIGIEINPEYIQIANKRLKPLLEQSRLILTQDGGKG